MTLNNNRYSELFSNLAKCKSILPRNLQIKRLNTEIKAGFPALKYPESNTEVDLSKQKYTQENEYEIFKQLIEKFTLSNINNDLILTDKFNPHALLEVMIMQCGQQIKHSIFDMEKQDILKCFETYLNFIKFSKSKQLYPHISFSYDPYTNDRQSGQSVKRFHSHLVARTNLEIEAINKDKVRLEDLDLFGQRRIIDETSIVGSYILCDVLNSKPDPYKSFEIKKPFAKFGIPNLILKLENGWETLVEENFISEIENVHKTIISTYYSLLKLITVGENNIWVRPKLKMDILGTPELEKNLIDLNLSRECIELFTFMLESLRISLLGKVRGLRQKNLDKIVEYIYPLAGPCYSLSLFEKNNSVYLCVRPFMFSSIGGAGIIPIDGVITQIQRGGKTMTEEEVWQRRSFQLEFVSLLK